jgi:hypothetical protein
MTGQRAAGAIFLISAALSFAVGAGIAYGQLVLGLALLLIRDQSKSELLRLLVFAWVLFSLAVVLIAAVSHSLWLPILPVILFGAGVAALMLERLEQRHVFFCAGVAIAGLLLSAVV